jgi:hypothetical protein
MPRRQPRNLKILLLFLFIAAISTFRSIYYASQANQR